MTIEASGNFIFHEDVWDMDNNGVDPFGLRKKLNEQGINILPSFFFDLNWPCHGGIKTSSYPLNQYLFNLQFGMVSEPLFKFKGARVFLEFQTHQTQHPSEKYVGDWQGFDNINAPNVTQLDQLWYEQQLFDQKLSLKFGKMSAYTTLDYTEYAQVLLNNSFSQTPTIIAFPSYPNTAVGVLVQYYPTKWLTLKSSLFDGSSALGIETGQKGARRFFTHLGQHALLINEVNVLWGKLKNLHPGSLGIGVWGLTAKLPNFKGGYVKGTAGSYAYVAQTVWKEQIFGKVKDTSKLRDLGAFLEWGACGKEVYAIRQYFGWGATFNSLVRALEDSVSIGMATVLFSNAQGAYYPDRYEMALEATYQFTLFNYFQVQPDFQYIIHPGGQGLDNAIVVTLRLMASM